MPKQLCLVERGTLYLKEYNKRLVEVQTIIKVTAIPEGHHLLQVYDNVVSIFVTADQVTFDLDTVTGHNASFSLDGDAQLVNLKRGGVQSITFHKDGDYSENIINFYPEEHSNTSERYTCLGWFDEPPVPTTITELFG